MFDDLDLCLDRTCACSMLLSMHQQSLFSIDVLFSANSRTILDMIKNQATVTIQNTRQGNANTIQNIQKSLPGTSKIIA